MSFYFREVLQHLNTFTKTNIWFKRVILFVIGKTEKKLSESQQVKWRKTKTGMKLNSIALPVAKKTIANKLKTYRVQILKIKQTFNGIN